MTQVKYKTVRVRKIPKGEGLKIRFLADKHEGETSFDYKHFNVAKKTAIDEGRKIIAMGDWNTNIVPTDRRRFSIEEHGETVAEQQHQVRVDMEDMKDLVEGWHIGNHEYSLMKVIGDYIGIMCEEIGIPYLGYQCNTLYKAHGGEKFTLYTTHGKWSFNYRAGEGRRKKTNYEVRVKDLLRPICWSDLSIMAHAHRGILSTPHYERQLVNVGKREYEERYLPDDDGRIFACCPSFLRIYRSGLENYASRSGLQPTGVGFIDLDLNKKLQIEDIRLILSKGKEFVVWDSLRKRIEKEVLYDKKEINKW